jgi:hypothetical protein
MIVNWFALRKLRPCGPNDVSLLHVGEPNQKQREQALTLTRQAWNAAAALRYADLELRNSALPEERRYRSQAELVRSQLEI